jgi:2-polyprenyl-3-methyl-5-hydroxy-6-metoxy-1,4-benzoquinol methylase
MKIVPPHGETHFRNESCPICGGENLRSREERLRDTDEIGVLECASCSHVFLDTFSHINDAYFARGVFMKEKPFVTTIEDRLRHYARETEERASRVAPLVVNKRILDFGCGAGGVIERLSAVARSIEGVEPTEVFRQWLSDRGAIVHPNIESAKGPYDAILLFHVLEHVPDPVETLALLSKKLSPHGRLYVEVPNVNDALLTIYKVDAARKFLFFSDHLHYFSRRSLGEAIQRAGLSKISLSGHNRFGLANHLYWLAAGKPGGHVEWSFLETPTVTQEYARALAAADMSDSLIAMVGVPVSTDIDLAGKPVR